MKSLGLLGARLVLGGYLAVHGAQKLFGSFGGHGLEASGAGFESLGMRPGKAMAALAGASELGGGVLTATGIASPLGPLAIMGTMAVASLTHRSKGPLGQHGGFELPLTNLAAAAALAAAGPGNLRLGPNLSPRLVRRAVLVGAGLGGFSAYQLLSHRQEEVLAAEEALVAEAVAAEESDDIEAAG
jgi:putative oxidoreductase